MPKRKKLTSPTPVSLRRSPRFHPQPPTIQKSKTNPTAPLIVCGISSKTSPRLSNSVTSSKHNKRSELLSDSNSGLRRSGRFKKWVSEGFYVRRSPRFVLKENSDNIVDKCVDVKLDKKSDNVGCFSEKDAETSEKGVERGVAVVIRMESESGGLVAPIGYKPPLLDAGGDCGNGEVERKRKRGEEGWTKEQEMALQRAYFLAKPTPTFWKKVSKLVPGKSARDCFDKIHSDHITPLHPFPRSRARKMNSSPVGSLSLSASKLLNSSGVKIKRPISNKQNGRLVHKTVRQLLQKCNRVDENYEADLFSALEPTDNLSILDSQVNAVVCTPKPLQEKEKLLQKCNEKASDLKKLRSKSSSSRINLVSPPVLKQLKNRALHEKYIDHLHTREAKRDAAAKRAGRLPGGKENSGQTNVQNFYMVKSAKDALVSDARDGIKQLEHLQANETESCSDFDDVCVNEMEDEADCVF